MSTLPPPPIDLGRLCAYRLGRLRQELAAADCAGALLFDPINVNYALGALRYPVFQFHLPSSYAFVPREGRPILFEGYGTTTRASHFDSRPAINLNYLHTGEQSEGPLARFRDAVRALVDGGAGRRLALDRSEPATLAALQENGLRLVNASPLVERARRIKNEDEIACIRHSIAVAELGIARMRERLGPGVTERELLSILQQTNVAHGGHWLEYELVVSGPRTNPWLDESSMRQVEAGELVAFDSGMVGPHGYCADVSRTFHCGPDAPTAEQRALYRLAHEELHHNIALLRPGLSFEEFSRQSWTPPAPFDQQRYVVLAHGVGLCDENPVIVEPRKWAHDGQDGRFEPGMVVSVESYIGAPGGRQGVKLEDEVLITPEGYEVLSTFPFEQSLLR